MTHKLLKRVGLLVFLVSLVLNSAIGEDGVTLEEPLRVIAKNYDCERVYRAHIPLADARKVLVVVFVHPSYEQTSKANIPDGVEYAIRRSRLTVGVFEDARLVRQNNVSVDEATFRQILGIFRRSEVFALTLEMNKTEYVSEAVLDSGLVTLESLTGDLRTVKRYMGQSIPVDYVANELRRIIAGKIGSEP